MLRKWCEIMRKIVIVFFVVIVLFQMGCTTRKSTFILKNESSSSETFIINDYPITIYSGNQYEEEFLLDEFLLYSEQADITVEFDGFLYLAPQKINTQISADQTKTITIENNRAGLTIFNSSQVAIKGVYTRTIGQGNWSDNYLSDFNNNSNFNVSVRPGFFDLKVIDVTNREFTLNDTVSFNIAETSEAFFDGFYLYYYGN